MVAIFKTKRNQANLFVDGYERYVINIPKYISEKVFGVPRKRISLRLTATDSNRLKATEHLSRIQGLIDSEDWNTLIDYEIRYLDTQVINFAKPKTFVELWDEYVNAKRAIWSVTYLEGDILEATKIFKLEQFNSLYPNDITAIIDYLMEKKTVKQAKRYLKQLSACLTWCEKRGYVLDNKLPDFISTLETKNKNDDDEIDPFTIEERDRIINSLINGEFERFKGSYSQYAHYAQFCFYTGCRTSEALGIEWQDIDFEKRAIIFQRAKVLNSRGKDKQVSKKGLKTQKKRVFPLSNQLENLLNEMKDDVRYDESKPLFYYVNQNSFRQSAWKKTLEQLGIRYRVPYQTRHTFISAMANRSGMKIHQIAKICGTSTSVIERHYLATNIDIAHLPDI